MKTPQQIRNEVEKEIKRFEDIENGLLEVESVRELELNSKRLFNAKKRLQILTEYDKSIKEMIGDVGLQDIIDFLDNLKNLRIDKQSSLNYEDGELPFGTCDYMAIDDMISKMKILSKIGDNSEVDK
jgi:hypothetical protein